MKVGTVLEQTRRWSLWIALGSAVVGLVIGLLTIWDVVSLVDIPSAEDILGALAIQSFAGDLAGNFGDQMGPGGLGDMMGQGGLGDLGALGGFTIPGPEITLWGRLMATAAALFSAASAVLLSLLVASHVKK